MTNVNVTVAVNKAIMALNAILSVETNEIAITSAKKAIGHIEDIRNNSNVL